MMMMIGDTGESGEAITGRVFVSYVREDSARVDWLCQELEAAGIPVWRDISQLWPGEDWRAVIRRAIRDDALAFLACFSHQSVRQDRTYQNEEILLAISEMRLRPPGRSWLIPVRFDDCQIPDRPIGGDQMLSDLQQADLFEDDCQQNADRLVEAIRRILSPGSTAAATPTASAAQVASRRSQSPKYVINVGKVEGAQFGDGNIQQNTFNK